MTVITTAPPETKLITGEELLAMGDIGPCELIDGRIARKNFASVEHGLAVANLGCALGEFVRKWNRGRGMMGGVGIYTRRDPDRVRGADIVFVSKERGGDKPQKGFMTVAPELVAEVMSPDDRWQDVRQKIEEYFSIGVQWVWVVEPENRTVLDYRSATEMRKWGEADVVRGEGVLEGFEMPVARLFEE
jgi:Uma2 family endonuclease